MLAAWKQLKGRHWGKGELVLRDYKTKPVWEDRSILEWKHL